MIRKTCCALLPFQAGALAAFLIGGSAWIAIPFIMGIAMLVFGFCRSKRAYAAVLSLSFCAGIAASCVYTAAVYDKTRAFDGQNVSVKGYVYDMKEYDGGNYRITVKGSINGGVTAKVGFYVDEQDFDTLTYGDEVTVYGEVYKIKDTLTYQSERTNRANGIFLRGKTADRIVSEGSNEHRIFRYARELRDSAYDKLCEKGGEGGRYLGAMLCGDRSGVDENISEEMYRAGIGHIFAFSGTHIAIMISAAAVILEAFGRRRAASTAVLLALTWGLVLFSGLSLSAVRAAVMMSVLLLASLSKHSSDPLTSLGIAGFMITAVSPYAVASNSFILSFAGAFACSSFAQTLGERMHSEKDYPPVGLKRTLITVFCAGLLLMPINALLFGRVSVISPVTNLVMIPVCTVCMIMGLTGLLLSAFPVLSGAFIWYASLTLKGCITLTGALSKLPFASICTYHPAAKAVMIFIIVMPAVVMILSYRKYMIFGLYALSAALMIAASAAVSYSERDKVHLIIYTCGGRDALTAYDTDSTLFASYKGGYMCFDALEALYLKRGLCTLDGVACGGDIPDMPLMTDSGTKYSSNSVYSDSLGQAGIENGSIIFFFGDKRIITGNGTVYNESDGYKYSLDEGALEIVLDKSSGESTVRRLDNGFDNTF